MVSLPCFAAAGLLSLSNVGLCCRRDSTRYKKAIRNFRRSMAGYALFSYIMQVGANAPTVADTVASEITNFPAANRIT